MKSPLPETEKPIPEKEDKEKHSEAETRPSDKHKAHSEKDSGYSDSSSDSTSSEETLPSTSGSTEESAQPAGPAQTVCTPIYILQNVVLKQPRIILVQAPLCRQRKRDPATSYLPILRSYPKIAPRVAPAPTSPPDTHVRSPSPPACIPPNLLEMSLRSLALLRRTRETQRSIRELKAHTILYERALHGEEGGWERLQRAMERSGAYRRRPPLSEEESEAEVTILVAAEESSAGTSLAAAESTPATPVTSLVGMVTSTADTMSSLVEAVTSMANTVSSLVSCTVTRDDLTPSSGKTHPQPEEAMTPPQPEAAMTRPQPAASNDRSDSAV